jgi:phage terminase small subunit
VSLSLKQQAFITAYLGEAKGNATQAAIMAGYSEKAASQVAHQVLRTPKVAEAIQARLDVHDIRTEAILKRLAKLAYSTPDKVTGADVIGASKVILQVNGALKDKSHEHSGITVNIGFLTPGQTTPSTITIDTRALSSQLVMGQPALVSGSPDTASD